VPNPPGIVVVSVTMVEDTAVRINLSGPVDGDALQTGSLEFEDQGGYIFGPALMEVEPGGRAIFAWLNQGDVVGPDTRWRLTGPLGTAPQVQYPADGWVVE
jgi:hypothetical protein